MTIGLTIRTLRQQQGLTQSALAARSGISSTGLAMIERGERDVTLKTVGKLARGLSVPSQELFAWLGETYNGR